jgi:hypothetical protein
MSLPSTVVKPQPSLRHVDLSRSCWKMAGSGANDPALHEHAIVSSFSSAYGENNFVRA